MVDFSALFKKKEDPKEHYFGLFLRGDSAVGFLFEIKNGVVSQIAKETCKYSNGWEGILDDIDELLSVLENETQIHIDKCIFFVYSYFIDQESQEIKEPYKDVIKRIAKELELKPMGYIECHEAIKDMLEKKEASPLNAVLVELDHNHLSYYVYKGGKMIHTDQTPRTDTVVDDLEELFGKNKDHFLLPSKVILYGSSTLEKESSEIKEHNWEKDLFIQAPRVTVVKSEDVLAGLSHTFMEQIEKDIGGDTQSVAADSEVVEDSTETDKEPTKSEKKRAPSAQEDDVSDEAESLGFVVGADIMDTDAKPPTEGVHMVNIAESFADKLPKMKMPSFKIPAISFGKGKAPKIVIFISSFVLIIGAAGGAEYAFHKAHIDISLPSDKISEAFSLQAPLTASGEGNFNIEKKTISKEQKQSIATSGQRDVGEKAKGSVVIHNFSDQALKLNSGIVLTADNLKYVLDGDVNVASQSEKLESGKPIKEPGTQNASVTAQAIGSEFNISKDKRLSINGLSSSSYFGLASSSFSGGSKKQLKTVAKKDLDTLQKEVLDAEKSKLLDEVKSELGPDENVIADLTEVKLGKATYSGEVGQEANDVTLTAEVQVNYYVFNGSNLKKEVADRLKEKIPNGFEIDKNKLAYKVSNSQKKSAEVDVNVKGEATVVKKIDKKKALASITGKTLDEARKILKEEFDADEVVIRSNNSPFFFLTSYLPFSVKNIDVTLKSE